MRTVGCQVSTTNLNDFVLLRDLEKGKAYTVQIGGVGAGSQADSGTLDVTANFVPDHDGDGIYDQMDACRTLPGVQRFDGCPPTLKPGLSWNANTSSGVRITQMLVTGLPGGSQAPDPLFVPYPADAEAERLLHLRQCHRRRVRRTDASGGRDRRDRGDAPGDRNG